MDAAPMGDSVETRMKRARAAAERAQQAEDEALEAAEESKESSSVPVGWRRATALG